MLSHSPTPPRSFPSPYLLNLMFFLAFSKKTHKKPTKETIRRSIQKTPNKMKQKSTKISSNLCCAA